MAEIKGTCDVSLHQRFMAELYFNCMGFSIGKNVIYIHKIFYIIQQTYKEELCAGFWVKGFNVKVDQDKSSLYLKRDSSLVLTNSGPQQAREMIVGLGWPYWTLGSTGLTIGSSLSSTSTVLESRPVGLVFKRIRMLDIYVQSTDFNVSN